MNREFQRNYPLSRKLLERLFRRDNRDVVVTSESFTTSYRSDGSLTREERFWDGDYREAGGRVFHHSFLNHRTTDTRWDTQ